MKFSIFTLMNKLWTNVLKGIWREIVIVILIIIIALSAKTCSNRNSDIEVLKHAQDSAYHVARFYRDRNREATFQVKSHEITIKQLKSFGEQLHVENGRLKKQIGSLNNLVGYYKVQASVRDTFSIIGHDTIVVYKDKLMEAKAFTWSNKFLTLEQLYHPSDSKLSTSYQYNPSFELVTYRKGKDLFADVRFEDQNVKVGTITAIKIKEEKKWWEKPLKWVEIGLAGVAGFWLGSQ